MISKEDIEEYKKIYKDNYNKVLTDKEAIMHIEDFLDFALMIYKPIKKK